MYHEAATEREFPDRKMYHEAETLPGFWIEARKKKRITYVQQTRVVLYHEAETEVYHETATELKNMRDKELHESCNISVNACIT